MRGMFMSRRMRSTSAFSAFASFSRPSTPSPACTTVQLRSIRSKILCKSFESSTTSTFFGFMAAPQTR